MADEFLKQKYHLNIEKKEEKVKGLLDGLTSFSMKEESKNRIWVESCTSLVIIDTLKTPFQKP